MAIKLERFVLGLILGPLAPLVGFLGAWWAVYTWLPEAWIPFVALSGLLLGILIDFFYLKRWVEAAGRFNPKLWAAIYLFYSVGIFGFFMGVPVFNAALSVPAGFVVGARLTSRGADGAQVRRAAGRTALFTTAVLALVCAASALIALLSPSTPSDLKGLLGLSFEVTQGMVVGLILAGGALLLALGWILAQIAVRFSFSFLKRMA
jgi:hypothetical protein